MAENNDNKTADTSDEDVGATVDSSTDSGSDSSDSSNGANGETGKVNDQPIPVRNMDDPKVNGIINRLTKSRDETRRELEELKATQSQAQDKPEVDLESTIEKVIASKFSSALEKVESTALKAEIKGVIDANPQFAGIEKDLERRASHPSRRNVPIDEIAWGILGNKSLEIGADIATNSSIKTQQSQMGGNKVVGSSTLVDPKDYKNLPPEEWAKVKAELARQGK